MFQRPSARESSATCAAAAENGAMSDSDFNRFAAVAQLSHLHFGCFIHMAGAFMAPPQISA
jgi:hypothetical protein